MRLNRLQLVLVCPFIILGACDGSDKKPEADTKTAVSAAQSPVERGPSLVLTQAQFVKETDASGKVRHKPGPAKMMLLSQKGELWTSTVIEDPESRVFHKAICRAGEIVTIGATDAHLKTWKAQGGKFVGTSHWKPTFGGKWDRLRDFEIGDVDHDGKPEMVIATHDQGVIAVAELDGGIKTPVEIARKAKTFIHEIEIGDVDGDGKLEFFATPSAPNKADHSQGGGVMVYRYIGGKYVGESVVSYPNRHAKEILVTDLDGDGKDELYVSLEAQIEKDKITKTRTQIEPLEIHKYVPQGKKWKHETVAVLGAGVQARVMLAADLTGSGTKDLIVTTFKDGIWRLIAGKATWRQEKIDGDSSGFEHAAGVADINGDGQLELYVAADDQDQIRQYTYKNGKFDRRSILNLGKSDLTWSIEACEI